MAGEGRQGPGSRGALWVTRGPGGRGQRPSSLPVDSLQLGSPSRPGPERSQEADMAEAAQQQAEATAAAAAAAGGSSEDLGPPAAPVAEEDPAAAASQVPIGAAREEEDEEEDEENVVSEATSVSSGDSAPPTPSANGYPGPRSGKEPRGTLGELVEAGGGGREAGHDRLSATQAPSPEWHECPECGRGFGTSRALKVHRSYHVGRKRPHSGSSAIKPPALLPPLVLSGNPPESQDGRTAPSGRGRAFHYICAECGLGFASPATLEGHRCEHGWRRSPPASLPPRYKRPPSPAAAEANGEQDADGADGPYHCTECSGKFGLVSELHQHYILHARGEL
ncbi:zinc finger protein 771-like isoform X2 [Sceloporus undulatus]|uniref:zinc finger protein 771-like isoform X2 n=1 Tax=Sceloporus undulatus TaxID=8520 RepID=UPI001C4DD56C|nr:zinc finger protein 771-like isoform X2 [Sceloporus undulatus]